jgi:PAS domain S-box-containing protein
MPSRRLSLLRYGWAILSVVLSLALTFVLWPGAHRPMVLFIGAVAISGWYGGRGPALVAAAVSGLAAALLLFEGGGRVGSRGDMMRLAAFAGVAWLIAWLSEGRRRAETESVAERKRAEEALERREKRFRALLEHGSDVVLLLDGEGTITYASPSIERVLGYRAEELVGRCVFEIVHPDHVEGARRMLDEIVAARGEPFTSERLVRHKDGSWRWIENLSTSLIDDASVAAVVDNFRDVTERRRAHERHEELLERERAARAQAEEASRLKEEFLSNVSHELRTPLNAVLGWAQMLRSRKLDPPTTARALEAIERSALAQARLINDILDFSTMMSGKFSLEIGPVELAPLVAANIESMRPAAAAKGLQIETRLDPLGFPISGDRMRLDQVIRNLLSNAIKFTPAGGRIDVTLDRVEDGLELAVSDVGKGISREFLPHVFEQFRQADSSTTREHGGLGLGLAIARHLVEMHGGSVRVESAGEGKGATFTVRLPVGEHDGSLAMPRPCTGGAFGRAREDGGRTLTGLRVLIVDDEPESCEPIRIALLTQGAEVRDAESAAEALDLCGRWRPDILVSDIAMPDVDGYGLIRSLRALLGPQGGDVPAVALTAHAHEEDRARALAAGYQVHLAKPVDPDDLISVVIDLAGTATK